MICRKCFNDMPDYASYCPECGGSIFSEEDWACRLCSGILRKDDNFCMRCGRSHEIILRSKRLVLLRSVTQRV